jgi:hypothetical protein
LAGLRYILPQLIELTATGRDKESYTRLLKTIPDLPRAKSEAGREYLLPAETGKRRNNCEKPECYALFPYRLYGVGLPELELARETFRLSPTNMNGQPRLNGWVQDPIFAACVGDAEGAARRLVERSKRFHEGSRFPAFWGPNFDWVPDQDFAVADARLPGRLGLSHGDMVVARVTGLSGATAPEEITSLLVLFDTSASRALGFEDQVVLLQRLLKGLSAGAGPAARAPLMYPATFRVCASRRWLPLRMKYFMPDTMASAGLLASGVHPNLPACPTASANSSRCPPGARATARRSGS